MCSRRGCENRVKKSTAKYCSVDCCARDPERHARLRRQAQRGRRSSPVLPMVRQLKFEMLAPSHPEASLALIGHAREDVPQGMSRLCS